MGNQDQVFSSLLAGSPAPLARAAWRSGSAGFPQQGRKVSTGALGVAAVGLHGGGSGLPCTRIWLLLSGMSLVPGLFDFEAEGLRHN